LYNSDNYGFAVYGNTNDAIASVGFWILLLLLGENPLDTNSYYQGGLCLLRGFEHVNYTIL